MFPIKKPAFESKLEYQREKRLSPKLQKIEQSVIELKLKIEELLKLFK